MFDHTKWNNYTTEGARCIAIDNDNTIWVGNSYTGLMKYEDSEWTTFTIDDGLISDKIYSITIEKNGIIWVGTDIGVSMFDGSKWENFDTSNGLLAGYVYEIVIDKSGNKWFLCYNGNGGVSKYDGENWTSYNTKNGLVNNSAVSAFIDKKGNIWIGTNDGISKISDIQTPIKKISKQRLDINKITALFNQFSNTVSIEFCLSKTENINVDLFNLQGKKISTLFSGRKHAGKHIIKFNKSFLSPGAYIYSFNAGRKNSVCRKLILF